MVLMMKIFRVMFILIIALCFSCEEEPFIVDCGECKSKEPTEATITIHLYDNPNNSSTDVVVYEGYLEDNIIYTVVSTLTDYAEVVVPVNKRYTITAIYPLASGTYIAVDSVLPRVKFDDQQCENPCYYVYDNTANLRLKKI